MKKLNVFFILSIVIGTLWFLVFQFESSRIATYLAVIPVVLAPCILIKTKYKLSDIELFFYYLFVFFAYFLGSVVNLYNLIWWYDVFMHFCSGFFTFMIGIFILSREKVQTSVWFQIFFGICVVMLVAGIWEFFEFGADLLLGMDLQHHLDTGVVDTMEDMLAAFGGGILASGAYQATSKSFF